MLPTFLVIGAPKAGTSSLHKYLAQHPGVFVPQLKEPCYFGLDDGCAPTFTGPGDDVEVIARTVTRRADYEALFADATPDQARGELSTQHLGMKGAAARAAALVPDAHIVAILREPAARAASHWAMKVGLGYETLGFADALDAEDRRVEQGYAPCWGYRRAGQYASQLEAWMEHYPTTQLRVLLFDDLSADTDRFVSEVFEFIGVDPTVPVDTLTRFNRTRGVRHTWLRSLTRSKAVLRAGRAILPRSARHRLLYRVDALTEPRAEPEAVAALRQSYRTELDRLEDLIGRDLSRWR